MKVKRRLSAAEFDVLLPLLRISQPRIAAARAVLVDGRTWQSVADEHGWKKQSTGDAVNVVWREFERYQETQKAASDNLMLPPGWERVTLVAPSYLIDRFRVQIARETAKK